MIFENDVNCLLLDKFIADQNAIRHYLMAFLNNEMYNLPLFSNLFKIFDIIWTKLDLKAREEKKN